MGRLSGVRLVKGTPERGAKSPVREEHRGIPVCDAESGSVPVSASAPSLLIQSIEVKRRAKSFQKFPLLPDPTVSEKGATK